MGVPLATPEEMGTCGKRQQPEERAEEPEPSRRRTCLGLSEVHVEFDVSELFSPARVALHAHERGLTPGFSLGIAHFDQVTHRKWNFQEKKDQGRLWSLLSKRPSSMLIVSPPCTVFSAFQRWRRGGIPDA